jgi:hypothetical protein
MNNPFEFQDALEGIVRVVRRIHRDITRELNEYEFKKLEESLKKRGNL